MAPSAPGEVVMVAGAPAPPSPPRSSGNSDHLPPSSPRDRSRGNHEDRHRDRSWSKSSDRAKTPPPYVPEVKNRHHLDRNHGTPFGHGIYVDNRRIEDYRGPGDDQSSEGGRRGDDYHPSSSWTSRFRERMVSKCPSQKSHLSRIGGAKCSTT